MSMKNRALFMMVCAQGLALGVPVGFAESAGRRLEEILGAETPNLIAAPADSDARHYRVQKFSIGLDSPGTEAVKLSIDYNNRTVWEGTAAAPGHVELSIAAATDFMEDPQPGYARNDNIYLYLRSAKHAAQWHVLRRAGRELKFIDPPAVTLHRKKFAVLEYEYYQGDDPDFAGRTPTHAGIAAVGHWGRLPGFTHDWQIWQGAPDGNLWGDTLRLEFHRGTDENGMIESTDEYEQMTKAPETGYVHYGGCGAPSVAARAGKSYYCRIVGHTRSTRGYGKIRIKEICEQPPAGMDILEN